MAMSPVKTRATKKGPPRKRSWNASGAGPFRYLPTSGRPLQIPDLSDLQVAGGDVAVASAIIITDGGLLYNTENRAAGRFLPAGSRARGRPWPPPGSGSLIEPGARRAGGPWQLVVSQRALRRGRISASGRRGPGRRGRGRCGRVRGGPRSRRGATGRGAARGLRPPSGARRGPGFRSRP